MTVRGESGSPPGRPTLVPLALAFLSVGLSAAMASPFLALFLNTALHADPVRVTTFLVVAPLSAVVMSTLVGRWSDRRGLRRPVVVGAAVAACLSAVMMALVRDYWVLLVGAATVTASAASLLPQLFAHAREALRDSPRLAMTMSALRTLFSVAWVAGPPLAAVLLTAGGFRLVYGTAAAMYALAAVVALRWLRPPAPRPVAAPVPVDSAGPVDSGGPVDSAGPDASPLTVALTAAGFVLLLCAGNLGVQALPLFIRQDLHGDVRQAGLILGLCALLEVPLMLGFGLLSTRFPLRRLLLVGAACSVTYYCLTTLSTSIWQVAAGQLLNASAIAAIAGLGVTYVQDLLPRHPGRASTLFVNTFPGGAILAGPILGTAQHLGYRFAYGAGAVLGLAGLVVLAASRRPPVRRGPETVATPRLPVESTPVQSAVG